MRYKATDYMTPPEEVLHREKVVLDQQWEIIKLEDSLKKEKDVHQQIRIKAKIERLEQLKSRHIERIQRLMQTMSYYEKQVVESHHVMEQKQKEEKAQLVYARVERKTLNREIEKIDQDNQHIEATILQLQATLEANKKRKAKLEEKRQKVYEVLDQLYGEPHKTREDN